MKPHKILLLVAGIALGLLIGEISMRLYYFAKFSSDKFALSHNPRLFYEHKPSIVYTNRHGIKIRHDSMGFIGEEAMPKRQGSYRILGIGDSITEAAYIPEEDRFLGRIAAGLSAHTGRTVECINAAVGGYNTEQEIELIKDKGLLIKPDLILVGICMNDYVDREPNLKKTWYNRVLESTRDGSKARHLDFLYQKSDLYKFLYDTCASLRTLKMSAKGRRSYFRDYVFTINERDFERWKASFLHMMNVAKENNVKILFVIFPMQNQVLKGEPYSYKPLSDFFKENNAYYVDLAATFSAHAAGGETLFLSRDLLHPNAPGHHIAADAIVHYVADNNIMAR